MVQATLCHMGPISPPTERGTAALTFRLMSIVAKRMDGSGQDTTWYTEVGLGPGDIALDGDPAPSPRKRAQQAALFGPLCSGMVAHLSNC